MSHIPCPYCGSPECSCLDTDEEYEEAAMEEATRGPTRCCWYKRPILTRLCFQGGSTNHPCHKRCLVVIKRSPDGGI